MAAAALPVSLEATDRRGISLLSVAHIINDANQSALPTIIPWLVAHRGLSLALAASLVLAMNLSSSVVQPLFGWLSDRRSLAPVIPIAMFVACAGTAMIGIAPSLPWMFVGALISGIGVAAFHPEGSRFANYFAGERRASGMSWFTLGGYLGFAIGPVVITPLILAFGLRGTAFLLIPGALFALLLWRDLPRFEEVRRAAHKAHSERAGQNDWRAFGTLTGVVALRSMTFLAAVTFIPIFAIRLAGLDKSIAAIVLAALLFGGAAGTWWGGRLADRFDRRRIISVSLFATALFSGALAWLGLHSPHLVTLMTLAIALGASFGLSAGVIVVLGQEYLPKRIGMASGVTLGLAVTVGGLAAPVFGAIGDRYGMVAVFSVVAVFAVLSLLGSIVLPTPSNAAKA